MQLKLLSEIKLRVDTIYLFIAYMLTILVLYSRSVPDTTSKTDKV